MRSAILRAPWVGAVLLLGCGPAQQAESKTPSSSRASTTGNDAQCPAGGPSVSVNIRGRAAGKDLPSDELGVLLGWIGGFVQPCREAAPEAPHFTLEIHLDSSDEPTLDLIDRAALPGLAACLDDRFSEAPPPPPGAMTVAIVIPWGCPTLGPGFQPGRTEPSAAPPPT